MSLAKTERTNLKRRMVSVSWLICQQSLIPGIIAIALLFSGEEGYGKYLDLYANHTAYNNLKNIGKRPGYLQYLDVLLAAQTGPVHSDLPKETRLTKDFETYAICFWYVGVFHAYSQAVSYIKDLHSYLLSFTKKTRPLEDVETRQRKVAIEFEAKWEANEILGWEDPSQSKKQGNGTETGGVWCSACEFLLLYIIITSTGSNARFQAKSSTQSKLCTMHILLQKSTSKLLQNKRLPENLLRTLMVLGIRMRQTIQFCPLQGFASEILHTILIYLPDFSWR